MRATAVLPILLTALLATACDDDKKGVPGGPGTAVAPTASASAAKTAPSPSAQPSASTADSAKPGPTPAAKLSPVEAVKALTKKFADAFNAHDPKQLAALYADNAVSQLMGEAEERGRAKQEEGAQKLFAAHENAKLTIGRTWVNKNLAFVEWSLSGTRVMDNAGQKVPGKPIGAVGLFVLTLNDDGTIASERSYHDILTHLGQFEPKLLPPGFAVRPVTAAPPAGTDVVEAKGSPEETAMVDVANKMYKAIEDKKPEEFLAFVTDDTVVDDFGLAAPMKGKKDIAANMQKFMAAFPDMTATKTNVFAAGDFIVCEWVMKGTHKGPLGGLKPSNSPVTIHSVDVFQMKDGKVAKAWSYSNNMELLQQIGALKLPAPAASGAASAAPKH